MEECIYFSHDTNLPPGNLPKGGGVQVLAGESWGPTAHDAMQLAGGDPLLFRYPSLRLESEKPSYLGGVRPFKG